MIAVAAPAGSIISGDGLVIGALLGVPSNAAAKGGTVMIA
jgi:hypothetical protein